MVRTSQAWDVTGAWPHAGHADALLDIPLDSVGTGFRGFNENVNATQKRRFKRIVATYKEDGQIVSDVSSCSAEERLLALAIGNVADLQSTDALPAAKDIAPQCTTAPPRMLLKSQQLKPIGLLSIGLLRASLGPPGEGLLRAS
eukprot:Skav234129  [mRNA]  locus=scaffold753:170733:172536:- [translate_table: standard]